MNKRRMIYIDCHVIAQFSDGVTGWYTASKYHNNDEDDFAVWNALNEKEALLWWKPDTIVHTDKAPIQRGTTWSFQEAYEWFISEDDRVAKRYYTALRELARTIE